MDTKYHKIVVAIPCYNEETTIGKVVADFRNEKINSDIVVIDNNSKDKTAEMAREAGAIVVPEKKRGKGYAVQRIFDEFEGDILVLVDGDDTYSAAEVDKLLAPLISNEADMVVGNRMQYSNKSSFSKAHWAGNKIFTRMLNSLFGTSLRDILSGYRAFNKNFINSVALLAKKFEVESELTIQAIEKDLKIKEVDISLKPRIKGSNSKIKAVRDGAAISYAILSLFRDYKPLKFFSILSFIFLVGGIILGWYSIEDYLKTGLVNRLPSLLVASFFILSSFVSFTAGLILSSVKRRNDEIDKDLKKILKLMKKTLAM